MQPPSIRIFSPDLVFLGEALGYTSAVYTRRWQGAGEFEIAIPLNAFGASQLQIGNIIMLDKDGRRTGIIQSIEPSEDALSKLNVKGPSLAGYCAQRITVPPDDAANMGYDNVPLVVQSGVYPDPVPAETVLKTYVARHMLSDPDRVIPLLEIAADAGRGPPLRWMSRFEDLSDVLRAVCEFSDIGYEIYFDTTSGLMVFDAVPGINRTTTSGISPVIFSSDFNNIENLSYAHSLSGYKNIGYAGGAGEDENRLIQTVWIESEKPTGRDRREVFLDAGALDIEEGLEAEGKQKLSDYPPTQSIEAAVSMSNTFVYRLDWDLGDLVTVHSSVIGVSMDARITVVVERYDNQAISIIPTFGAPQERFGRTIKKITSRNTVR